MKAPFFIVGSPRSGTTLVRAILDSHSRLSIPPESHFIVALDPDLFPWRRRFPTVDDVVTHPAFVRWWQTDPDQVRRDVEEAHPRSYAEFIAAIFEGYARAHGKARWGDKTPGYISYLPRLATLFPTARFLHVIRDGREVAASLADRDWGPPSAVSGALSWRLKVQRGVRDGRKLGAHRYTEIHLEELIRDPEETVAGMCDFLGEPFETQMLSYYERYRGADLGADWVHLSRPISHGLRDWRAGRSAIEQRAIEELCRPLLASLGYSHGKRDRAALCWAFAVLAKDVATHGPNAVIYRMKPRVRIF